MLWCCITPERTHKTRVIMQAFAKGWPGGRVIRGRPPNSDHPFVVWGQLFLTLEIVPDAIRRNRPFWIIDNGYHLPARGGSVGYYRLTYRGLMPAIFEQPDYDRANKFSVKIEPWRKTGRHILFASPGHGYGQCLGLDMARWQKKTLHRLDAITDRPIIVRDKILSRPLDDDFRDCWAVVTHSSNVAVQAVLRGIPVFVEPTSAAASVGNLDLTNLESPVMPDNREAWWASLLGQQFSIPEMANGTAYRYLSKVIEQCHLST